MSALLKTIKQNRILAMKSKDTLTRKTLDLLLAKIEKAQIENKGELTDVQVQEVISKSLKELDKEIESYVAVGRSTEKQLSEKQILLSYMPEQLTDEEIKSHILHTIELVNRGEVTNIMQYLSQRLKGKADMKKVSNMAKAMLENK